MGSRLFWSVVLVGSLVAGCSDAQYKQSDLQIISTELQKDGASVVVYQAVMESLFYSPGANVVAQRDRYEISFVRCGIKEKCPVDLKAEGIGQGSSKLVIPAGVKGAVFMFSDGEVPLAK